MTLILFETFNVSAIYVAIQAVLSLCGSLHRDETCLPFRLKRLFRWANSAVPVATVTSADPLAPVFPVCYAATAPIVEYVSPAPAGSYVAPAPVVDTTRRQWCSRLKMCSCLSVAPAPVLRHWRHPQCTPHMDPLSSTPLLCLMPQLCSIVEHISPVPAGSYVAPEPVVDTTRPFQWCLLLGARRRICRDCFRSVRGASAFGGSTSRPLQSCTWHKRLWWSASRSRTGQPW